MIRSEKMQKEEIRRRCLTELQSRIEEMTLSELMEMLSIARKM